MKKSTYHYIRVGKNQVMQLQLNILKSNDSWFSEIHFQEVLVLLNESILFQLHVNSADCNSDINVSQPEIIHGERIKIGYCLRKNLRKQWLLIPKKVDNISTDFSIKNYEGFQLAKEKILVCVCPSSSSISTGVSEIFRIFSGVGGSASHDQTLISNYFKRYRPASPFHKTSKQKEALQEIMRRKAILEKQKKPMKSFTLKNQLENVSSKENISSQWILPNSKNAVQNIKTFDICYQKDLKSRVGIDESDITDKIEKNPQISKSISSESSISLTSSEMLKVSRGNKTVMCGKKTIRNKNETSNSKNIILPHKQLRKSEIFSSDDSSALNSDVQEKDTLDLLVPKTKQKNKDNSTTKILNLLEDIPDSKIMSKSLKAKPILSKSSKRKSIEEVSNLKGSSSSDQLRSGDSTSTLKTDLKAKTTVKMRKTSAGDHPYKSFSSSDTSDEWNDFKTINIRKKAKNRDKTKKERTEKLIDKSNIEYPSIQLETSEDLNSFRHLQFLSSLEARRLHLEIRKVETVSLLTETQIKYLVISNEAYFRDIFGGKIYCKRHEDYKKGGLTRVNLNYQVYLTLFTPDQHTWVMDALMYMFCKNHQKYLDYLLKVLFPETLIKIYMQRFQNSHSDTEKIMIEHIEIPKPRTIVFKLQ